MLSRLLATLIVVTACRSAAPRPSLEPDTRVVLPRRDSPGALTDAERDSLLRDTAGKSLGTPREPWSTYTVEGLFDAVEQGALRLDVLVVAYDPTYRYPAQIRGDARLGLPDDWFWVKASRLTPTR